MAFALAFYSVVAWQVLALTYAMREDPGQKPDGLFDDCELQVLRRTSPKPIVSLGDAVVALGRMVGVAPSKKQPFPGVKVLSTALERLAFAAIGFRAAIKPLQD